MAVFAAAAHKKVEVPEISFDFKANMLSSNYWKTVVIMYKIYYAVWWTAGFTLKFIEKKKLSARKRVSREVRVSKKNNSSYLT